MSLATCFLDSKPVVSLTLTCLLLPGDTTHQQSLTGFLGNWQRPGALNTHTS